MPNDGCRPHIGYLNPYLVADVEFAVFVGLFSIPRRTHYEDFSSRDRWKESTGFHANPPPVSLARWTITEPTITGTYWLRHAVFRQQASAWHEPYPVLVEVRADGKGGLNLHVQETGKVWSLTQVVVAEWAGPLVPPA